MDVVAGSFWYEGPAFRRTHEIYPSKVFPTPPSPTDSLYSFVHDFNGDGWPDALVVGRVHLHQAFWYENPQDKPGYWPKHFVHERVQAESPAFADDVDGDGDNDIITSLDAHGPKGDVEPEASPVLYWFQLEREGRQVRYVPHLVDEQSGVGCQVVAADMDGDGRPDTRLRWERAAKERALDLIRNTVIIETHAEQFLDVLKAGTVSTNVHLRKLHNFCLDLGWLPVPVLPKIRSSRNCARRVGRRSSSGRASG